MTQSIPTAAQFNAESSDDAQFTIVQNSEWIRNADTKAGFLLAALAVVVSNATSLARGLIDRSANTGGHVITGIVLAFSAIILLTTAAGFIVKVLIPRIGPASFVESRFAWPWLATQTADAVSRRGPSSIRQEGWMQAIVLGRIVKAKLSAFRIALIFASAGAFLLLIAAALSYLP